MAFQLSPGVVVTEKDLTSIVPAIATTAGAFAGAFQWGPVEEVVNVDSENNLVKFFGAPDSDTYKSFFTAANFLGYGNNLQVVRAADKGVARTSVPYVGISTALSIAPIDIPIPYAGPDGNSAANLTITFEAPPAGARNVGLSTATGSLTVSGNAITGITVLTTGSGYTFAPNILITWSGNGQSFANIIGTGNVSLRNTKVILNDDDYEQNHLSGSSAFGEFCGKYPGIRSNSIRVALFDSSSTADFNSWTYKNSFRGLPGTSTTALNAAGANDEIHIAVVDIDGKISGTAGTVLEKYEYVSKGFDAKNADGSTNYYKDVINQKSEYIRWLAHPNYPGVNFWGSSVKGNAFTRLNTVSGGIFSDGVTNGILTLDLAFGAQGAPTVGNLQSAYSLFSNDELYDVSLVPVGDADMATVKYIVDNVAEVRKDCIVFLSPDQANVVYSKTPATNTVAFRNSININSSYAVMDSGWKYQYDRYNDVYRWVPLNGDTAGITARTDFVADPWFSPAGFTRGQVKNIIKLAYSPTKTDRDSLYKNEVNPIVAFPGEGTVLFGDKTMLTKPSAFDRINVRRLFIVLEKAIATAAKFQLFEFNDAFTRAQFRNLVEPFLRDVQGRRGVTDFRVICDETNNTAAVIDRNEFVADIYIKPARSINFIQLNFIATRSGISFEEVGA
jgi:hypothetical protein